MNEEEKKKSIEKIEKWLRNTSSLISEKVYGQASEQVSEEEKKAIEITKTIIEFAGDSYIPKENRKALQTLLTLIDNQQKEIEELKKENFDTVYIQAIENYKTKIREKIKELNKENINADETSAIFNIAKMQVLNELLEE